MTLAPGPEPPWCSSCRRSRLQTAFGFPAFAGLALFSIALAGGDGTF